MTAIHPASVGLDPVSAAPQLADFGFLSVPDLPDRPGPAYLLVALRKAPTLHHYDPEAITYWVGEGDRGVRRTLTRHTQLPVDVDFAWGLIQIVDRLHVTNEYLTFGGRLMADDIDGLVVAVFSSPAPLLRRGGHSQGWDQGADNLGAYFGRFMIPIDYAPGFEGRAARSDPVTLYAAFLVDAIDRFRASPALRAGQPDLWPLLLAEETRIRAQDPGFWSAGEALRRDLQRHVAAPVAPTPRWR